MTDKARTLWSKLTDFSFIVDWATIKNSMTFKEQLEFRRND